MNLKPIRANMNEVTVGTKVILFSYQTPVAMIDGRAAYQTEKKWSRTTSRHVTQWLGLHPEYFGAQYKPQEYFDNLLNEVK